MDATQRFSTKADVYAAHRWEYAPAAIDALVETIHLQLVDVVADIGSGTGMVARHFVERGFHTFAIEPNAAMRAKAEHALGGYANFHSVDARSDATGLPDHSVSLITIGRALHWLPVVSTRQEFVRILKPQGWIAVMGVSGTSKALHDALEATQTADKGWDLDGGHRAHSAVDINAFLGGNPAHELHVAGTVEETWTQFCGRMLSFSPAPDTGSPGYDRFIASIRAVFDAFAIQGIIMIPITTDVTLGQLYEDPSQPAQV